MIELFWDKEKHGFFLYGNDSEELIVRPKELYDGAIPSGNSIAAYNLLQLSKITSIDKYSEKAEELFKGFGSNVEEAPTGYTFYATSLMLKNTPGSQIVLCGNLEDDHLKEMLRICNEAYDPFRVVTVYDGDEKPEQIIQSTKEERKGLIWAGIVVLGFAIFILLGTVPETGYLRDPVTGSLLRSPFMSGIVTFIFLIGAVSGVAYGVASGTFKRISTCSFFER